MKVLKQFERHDKKFELVELNDGTGAIRVISQEQFGMVANYRKFDTMGQATQVFKIEQVGLQYFVN